MGANKKASITVIFLSVIIVILVVIVIIFSYSTFFAKSEDINRNSNSQLLLPVNEDGETKLADFQEILDEYTLCDANDYNCHCLYIDKKYCESIELYGDIDFQSLVSNAKLVRIVAESENQVDNGLNNGGPTSIVLISTDRGAGSEGVCLGIYFGVEDGRWVIFDADGLAESQCH